MSSSFFCHIWNSIGLKRKSESIGAGGFKQFSLCKINKNAPVEAFPIGYPHGGDIVSRVESGEEQFGEQ